MEASTQLVQNRLRFTPEAWLTSRVQPTIYMKPELWPMIRDYLEKVGVQVYTQHLFLSDLRPYHMIADGPCFDILADISRQQPKSLGVFIQRHEVLHFPEAIISDAWLDAPRG